MTICISNYHLACRWRWRIVRHFLQLSDSDVVLDAGCGEGFITAEVAATGSRAVGVDIDEKTISRNRALRHRPNLSFEARDLARLNDLFVPQTFTSIVCMDVLEHAGDVPAILGNFFSLLRPGGRLCFTVPLTGHGHYGRGRDETEAMLEGMGFSVEYLKTIRPGPATELTFRIFNSLRWLCGMKSREVDRFSQTNAFAAGEKPSLLTLAYVKLAFPVLEALSRLDRVPLRQPGVVLLGVAVKPLHQPAKSSR